MLDCPSCKTALPVPSGQEVVCPGCTRAVRVELFPVALRPVESGPAAEALVMDAESSCFYHPSKRAVIPCESCGRFLCSLCDLDTDARHICPVCFERERKQEGEAARAEGQRTLRDRVAFDLVALMLLVPCAWYIVPLLAIPVIVYGIRYWNAPRSVFSHGKWRMAGALSLAFLMTLLWCVAVIGFVTEMGGPF